jgi:hypothetical protein
MCSCEFILVQNTDKTTSDMKMVMCESVKHPQFDRG